MINFFIVKMYQAYLKKDRGLAKLKTTSYLSLLLHGIVLFLLYLMMLFLNRYVPETRLKPSELFFIISTLSIYILCYKVIDTRYFKNGKIHVLEAKYRNKHMPTFMLYLIMVFAPVILLLSGVTLITFLFGGTAFGNRIEGLLP